MLKLVSITLPVEKPQEMGLVRTINCVHPTEHVIGWSVLVRGPAVILVSPAKDKQGRTVADRRLYEFARSACVLVWSSSDIADANNVQKYDSQPLERPEPSGAIYEDAAISNVVTSEAKPSVQQGGRK